MKKLLLVLAFAPVAAYAQPASVQVCAGCHGAQGEGNTQTNAPLIAGQLQAYLEHQLDAFAAGRRNSRTMTPIAQGLSADQRRELAAYYAGLSLPGPRARQNAATTARKGPL